MARGVWELSTSQKLELSEEKKLRRLGVFVFYDPQGVVDDYIVFLLESMRKVCTEIVTVCNGILTEEGYNRLSRWSETILCRENAGMDAGALKDFFTNLRSREYWSNFDELVWFNDTCYGPLVPMDKVFEEMNQRDPCDFWGISIHAKSNAKWPGSKQPGIAEHLQSYFIVIRRPLLRDERFYSFWKDMKISNNFNLTVSNYELSLTQTFASWGYTYAAFCDTRKLDTNPDCVCNPTADAMYRLVSQYRCPFVKRKNFIRTNAEATVSTNGEQVMRSMSYIRSHTTYDTALIYHNLMRLYDQELWQGNLCLSFTLSSEYSANDSTPPALIVAELDHEDSIQELSESLYSRPKSCDLNVVTRCEELIPVIKKFFPSCEITFLPSRPQGLASLFLVLNQIETDKYTYFCILQEVWGKPLNSLHISESSIRFSLYGNLVAGPHFIRNVLYTFESEPLLGILNPPIFPQSRTATLTCFNLTQAAKDYGIALPHRLSDYKAFCQPSVWCRKEVVLSVLEKLNHSTPPMSPGVLEHLLCFIALNIGYSCGEVKECRQAACLQESQRWLIDGFYSGNIDLELFQKRQNFQIVAAIRSGRCKPEEANITPSALRKLLWETVIYWFEKKLNPHISSSKKDTFFLGIRDVYDAYCRVAKVQHHSSKNQQRTSKK